MWVGGGDGWGMGERVVGGIDHVVSINLLRGGSVLFGEVFGLRA